MDAFLIIFLVLQEWPWSKFRKGKKCFFIILIFSERLMYFIVFILFALVSLDHATSRHASDQVDSSVAAPSAGYPAIEKLFFWMFLQVVFVWIVTRSFQTRLAVRKRIDWWHMNMEGKRKWLVFESLLDLKIIFKVFEIISDHDWRLE